MPYTEYGSASRRGSSRAGTSAMRSLKHPLAQPPAGDPNSRRFAISTITSGCVSATGPMRAKYA